MYRIELAPGEETALRTIEELAAGIRSGVVTSRARIWHNAGQKWLPIEFHPHYQAALKKLETAEPGAAPEPATGLASAPSPGPAAVAVAPTVQPLVVSEPVSTSVTETAAPASALATHTPPQPKSQMRALALVIGGIALIAAAQMAASAAEPNKTASSVDHMAATVPTPASQRPPVTPDSTHMLAPAARPTPAEPDTAMAPSIDTTTMAPSQPAADTPTHTLGGVVHGPSTAVSAPSPVRTPKADDEESLPAIAPAPVITGLPLPAPPIDTLH